METNESTNWMTMLVILFAAVITLLIYSNEGLWGLYMLICVPIIFILGFAGLGETGIQIVLGILLWFVLIWIFNLVLFSIKFADALEKHADAQQSDPYGFDKKRAKLQQEKRKDKRRKRNRIS